MRPFRSRPPASRNRSGVEAPLAKREFMSYHSSNRSNDQSTGRRGQDREQSASRRRFKRTVRLFFGTIILILLAYTSVLSTDPLVVPLDRRSDVTLLRNQDIYYKGAKQILNNSIFSRNKITVDNTGFEREMKEQFPELDQAVLTLPVIGRRPTTRLVAKQPVISLITQQGVYLLDKNGQVLIKAIDVTGLDNLQLRSVTDESNLPVEVGKGGLTAQQVTYIRVLADQIIAAKQTISSITLPPIVNELRVRIKDRAYYARFDMQNDPRLSAGAYLAFNQKVDLEHLGVNEYVDMRLDERIFYK